MLSEDEKFSLIDQGLELYKTQQYYLCHEVLESVWREEEGARQQLIQAIIQVAVACYHSLRGNRKGALSLSQRAMKRLLSLPAHTINRDSSSLGSIDLKNFLQELEQFQESLRMDCTEAELAGCLPKIMVRDAEVSP